jgi:mRNA interferase RelE/StbE
MGSYKLSISATAERQLRRLPKRDLARVAEAMERLASDPHPRGMRKLVGYEDVFRIRVGRYRVLYSVDRREVIVVILKIGHRRDVYR